MSHTVSVDHRWNEEEFETDALTDDYLVHTHLGVHEE